MPRKNVVQEEIDDQDALDEPIVFDSPQKKLTFKKIVLGLLVLFFLLALFFGKGYFNAKQEIVRLQTPEAQEQAKQAEVDLLLEAVSKHMILPENEVPIAAEITDRDSLAAEQNFYKNAQNGDQLLVYIQNQQAIIYSPSRDIIVNVGPIVLSQDQAGQVTSPQN